MENLTTQVLLNTPKAHRERINLLHTGAWDDVSLIRKPFPVSCELLWVGWIPPVICVSTRCRQKQFSPRWWFSSNSLKPALRHLVSLNQCAAHCKLPCFVASRQNNWWYQLRSAYCLTITLACFTALEGGSQNKGCPGLPEQHAS